jgi:hypothetical protein
MLVLSDSENLDVSVKEVECLRLKTSNTKAWQ